MKRPSIIILAAFGYAAALARGSDFVNLTFDAPDLSHARYWLAPFYGNPPPYYLYAPVEEALRGWRLSGNLNWVPYKGLIRVDDGGTPFGLVPYSGPLFGRCMLWVNDVYLWGWIRPEFSLAQIGEVPADAGALFFYQGWGPPELWEPIRVLVNGVEQAVVAPSYGTGMVDCSPYAGLCVELRFVFPAGCLYDFDIFGFGPLPGAPTPVIIRQIAVSDGQVILTWTGPSPRYQVQQKAALDLPWENVGLPVTQTNWTNAVTAPLGFFRVVGLPE